VLKGTNPKPLDGGLRLIPLTHKNCPCKCLKLIGKAQLHCLGIGINADDSAVVSVSALYGASAAAYARKTHPRMLA